jgi:hypothetical protein
LYQLYQLTQLHGHAQGFGVRVRGLGFRLVSTHNCGRAQVFAEMSEITCIVKLGVCSKVIYGLSQVFAEMSEIKGRTKADKIEDSHYKTSKRAALTRLEVMHLLQTQRFENLRESLEVFNPKPSTLTLIV